MESSEFAKLSISLSDDELDRTMSKLKLTGSENQSRITTTPPILMKRETTMLLNQ